jgi:hypothetical protein
MGFPAMKRLIGCVVLLAGLAAIIAAGWLTFRLPTPH